MSLNDPFFTKFDGSPDLGRVPVRLVVNGSGRLSPWQFREVESAYHQFRESYRLSAANFHTERLRLSDGSWVWLWSLQGNDEVTVWPSEDGEGTQLPHGFAVATNWQAPLFYCRDTNSGIQWLVGPDVPQIVSHTTTHFDNQVFRKDAESDAYFNLPHVRDHSNTGLWDYRLNEAPEVSPTPVVPFLLKNSTTDQFTIGSPHYAAGGKLIDASGATLYTMADEAPILTPAEAAYQHPGVTDASGNQVALQAMRYAVISPTYNIWRFKLWSERLIRTGETSYTLVERAATDMTTPWGKQTTTTALINDNSLGEDPALLFKFKATFVYKPGAYSGGGSGRLYNVGWAGPDQWVDITGVPIAGQDNNSLRQIKEQSAGVSTLDKLVATAGATETGYIPIESRLNYPASVFWRGGSHGKWYYPENLVAYFGWAPGTSLPLNYRVYSVNITRYDTKYDVDGTPTITAKLGWKDLQLLEGTTTGRMSGKEYINALQQNGSYNFIDSSWSYRWITKEIRYDAEFFDPITQYAAYWAWMDEANVKDEYWADYMAYGTHPGHTQTTAPQPINKYEYPFNERPYNTVSYALKSRYVIDFDQKGRFYAAIRCEVTATGAAWKEDIAVYKGFMVKDTDPTYTVKIWFECEWGGVFAQQLLVEETITRPMFEAITVSQFSPWYWPFPAYLDRDCKVRTPPEPVPDENFMMMFKNLASHQGVNTNLCCADVRPDIVGAEASEAQSKDGIEYSYEENGIVTPHTRYVTGQLYARTFKLNDIPESLWLLKALKCDAVEDNFQPIDGPEKPTWYYHPVIKAALDVTRHIEVRDGVIVQWSDNIPTPISGYPPTPEAHPAPTNRTINLYRV